MITPYIKNDNKLTGPSICILLEQNKTSNMVPTISYCGTRIVSACVVALGGMYSRWYGVMSYNCVGRYKLLSCIWFSRNIAAQFTCMTVWWMIRKQYKWGIFFKWQYIYCLVRLHNKYVLYSHYGKILYIPGQ